MKITAKSGGLSLLNKRTLVIGRNYYTKYQIYQGPYYYIKDDIGYDWYPVSCFVEVSEFRNIKLDILLENEVKY